MATTVGKKIKVRKRHIGVDIEGHLLHVEVSTANIHDTKVGGFVIEAALEKYPTIQAAFGDAGYQARQWIIQKLYWIHQSTFQRKFKINLLFCRSVGLLNEPLYG